MNQALPSRRQPRVLLVDDEPKLLLAMKRALHREPFAFTTAGSAHEALKLLDRESFDAIVSDQDMPGMNGVEMFSIVRRLHPNTVRFMLTGKATLDVAIDAINRGSIQRFFTKPMDPAVLAASLHEALAQKALIEESWKLVNHARAQAALLQGLESRQPGITQIQRDAQGAIVLEDVPESIEDLLDEISGVLRTDASSRSA